MCCTRTHRMYADALGVSCQIEEVVREGQTQQCSNIRLDHFYVGGGIHVHMDFTAETVCRT